MVLLPALCGGRSHCPGLRSDFMDMALDGPPAAALGPYAAVKCSGRHFVEAPAGGNSTGTRGYEGA